MNAKLCKKIRRAVRGTGIPVSYEPLVPHIANALHVLDGWRTGAVMHTGQVVLSKTCSRYAYQQAKRRYS